MEAKKEMKDMNLLEAMEHIVALAKGSGLSDGFYNKADEYICFIADKLQLSKEQSVMLSLFVDNSDSRNILASDIAEFLQCTTIQIIKCMNDIDELVRREYIIKRKDDRQLSFRVPIDVIEALRNNEAFVVKAKTNLSASELMMELETVFEMRGNKELSYEQTANKTKCLLENNVDLAFSRKLREYDLNEEDQTLLILFCHLFANNNDDEIRFHDIEFLFPKRQWNRIKCMLNAKCHTLQYLQLIEYGNGNGLADRETFCLTRKAKRELLSELNFSSMPQVCKGTMKAKDIVAKQLFYENDTQQQIAELEDLLDENRYQQIHSRMKEAGFRCGFTCLFYGAPGVGKTETVLQLARKTGRNIIQVNVEQIKSMWVGESEKNIKALFDDYRNQVESQSLAPILLFNEADAVIGMRHKGAERATDKMENALQNIILQEMERIDGILIATTNLVQNFDKAFERRFLYKVKFNAPSIQTRRHIWQSIMPEISEESASWLASHYNLSGGQIENVARRYAINTILYGPPTEELPTLCKCSENESKETYGISQIGFSK
ncbi:MAG: ATP-binding protein [Prevotella sp.]